MPATILCLIVAIVDGDTLKVRCPEQPQQTVRLAYIDAPEKRQPFGEASRQHLAAQCFQTQAGLTPRGHDRYKRLLASVKCRGNDAGAEQVRAGMAWAFTRYRPPAELVALQVEARAERWGLWSQPDPVPPWEWRGRAQRST